MKKINYFKFLCLMGIALVLVSSCKKDDDDVPSNQPAYVGTWSISESFFGISSEDTYVFKAASYSHLTKALGIELSKEEGTLAVADDILTLTPTKMTLEGVNITLESSYKLKFSIANNKITLKGDEDNDGTYGETSDEIFEYPKK